jgi:hypothetical protein
MHGRSEWEVLVAAPNTKFQGVRDILKAGRCCYVDGTIPEFHVGEDVTSLYCDLPICMSNWNFQHDFKKVLRMMEPTIEKQTEACIAQGMHLHYDHGRDLDGAPFPTKQRLI